MNAISSSLPPPGSVAVILPAAGRSQRFQAAGDQKKIFAPLAGRPVWEYAAERLRSFEAVGPMVVVIAEMDRCRWETEFAASLRRLEITMVTGGSERVESVQAALRVLPDTEWIAVHDAARPLITRQDITAVLSEANQHGAAILATPVRGTLKQDVGDRSDCRTLDRSRIWEAQTPQVFRGDWLREAYGRWRGRVVTDDAQLVELAGHPVRLVQGSDTNLKITRPEDLRIAEALLAVIEETASTRFTATGSRTED